MATTRKSTAAAKKVPAPKAPARRSAGSGLVGPHRALDDLLLPDARVTRDIGGAAAGVVTSTVAQAFAGAKRDEPLTLERYADAARELNVEVAALRAIAQVETRAEAFNSRGWPTILYERHVFARCCVPKGRFNVQHPELSSTSTYVRGAPPDGYGTKDQQWTKLDAAFALDPDAALKACSWGTFQILGENHKACGYADVRSFVAEMFASPAGHLRALVSFVKASPSIHKGLKNLDWDAVARGYNGPRYAEDGYHTKMAKAYAALKAAG